MTDTLDIHIVTDSGAQFVEEISGTRHPVTIVPYRIVIGSKSYREGVDLPDDELIREMMAYPDAVKVIPPTVDEFVTAYTEAARTGAAIVSIHTSRELSASWANARRASQQFSSHGLIAVVDSLAIGAAQGMLVQIAADAIATAASFDSYVRTVRGSVERIYSIYYAETVDALVRTEVMSKSHGLMGDMLGIKPLLSIEDGKIVATEKVRSRAQAIERMIEFVVEFTELERIVILQPGKVPTEQTRQLRDRLAAEFEDKQFPFCTYSPSLAALIGTDSHGLVILEEEMDDEHEF